MKVTLVFDMDGTIADLYHVDGWLQDLEEQDPRPYKEARPMCDMDTVRNLLIQLQNKGVTVAVTSWLSKHSTRDFDSKVRYAKKRWLDKQEFPYDEVHFVKYGTDKQKFTKKYGGVQFLFDDSQEVRENWKLGPAIDPTQEDIITCLKALLD